MNDPNHDSLQVEFGFGDIGKAIKDTANKAADKVKDVAVNKVAKPVEDVAVNKVAAKAIEIEKKAEDIAVNQVYPVVKKGALTAYCHAKKHALSQVEDWKDDWTNNVHLLKDGCGKGGGNFTKCITAISETKNTEIIHGVPISYGDVFTYASNIILPGSGAFLEGASTGIDVAATGSVIIDSLVHPPA